MNFEKELKDALQEYETSLVEHYTELQTPERRYTMKGWKRWAAALAAVFVLVVAWQMIRMFGMRAGSAKADIYMDGEYGEAAEPKDSVRPREAPAASEEALEKGGDNLSTSPVNPEEKIIRYFNMTLETKELLNSINKLEAMVKNVGGYIESSYRTGKIEPGEFGTANYTLRIPKNKEQEAKLAIEDLGETIELSQNNENVTQYYRDTESRANFLKAKEEKLLKLMDKAETLEDVITLESKVLDIQYERERLASSLRDIDNRVDYDTYNVQLRQVKAYTEVGFARKIRESFILSIERFKDFSEGLILFVVESWIFLLVLVVIIIVVTRVLRKKGKRLGLPRREKKNKEING